MFGLTQIQTYIVVAGLAVVLVGGAFYWTYNKGEKAGSSEVTIKVQQKTQETLDNARTTKEKADADVRSKPYGERVDGLR